MGLFGQSSPFDADVEKATSEKNTSEQWGVIIDICDKVGSNPRNAKDCLKSIMRRMGHNDPHVVIQAITLLDACVNNCGKNFHLEVASRDFENEFTRLLSKAQAQVAMKMRLLLKKWAENDFKSDPQLNLIPSFYQRLKSEGHDFSDNQKTPKSTIPAFVIKDPNVVTSQQEEDDIAKAIELSLKEAKDSPKKQQQQPANNNGSTYTSLYPWLSGSGGAAGSSPSSTAQSEARKVRALYDFEAVEDNELTFVAGDIIHVLDDTDPNWWKGYNQRGEGLFPSNFVTADLSVEPERLDVNTKSNQSDDTENQTEKTDSKLDEDKDYIPEINEEKVDRLLHLLHDANPEDSSQDSEEMLRLEIEVNKMGPLIDTELERVDRKHAQLTQLSSDLVDAINLYHTLMREPDRTAMPPVNATLPGSMGGYHMPGNFNTQPSLYGNSAMYGLPMNMYQPGLMTQSSVANSMPGMPMMAGGAAQQHQPQPKQPQINHQLSQMPMLTHSTNPGGFPLQHMPQIPYQNGHQPHQQQPISQPQAQAAPLQQQQLHNSIPTSAVHSVNSPASGASQLIQQYQQQPPTNSMNQQHTVTNFHSAPSSQPASMGGVFVSQPNSFVPIPNAANYSMPPPHPAMLQHNAMLGGMMPPQ